MVETNLRYHILDGRRNQPRDKICDNYTKTYCTRAEVTSSNKESLVIQHFTENNYLVICLLKKNLMQELLNLEYMKVYIDVYAHVRHVEHPSSNPVANIEAALRQVDQLKQDIFKM